MNIVNKLTLRHMKQNKRRTLVTILGVIISVAMITAVATIGLSFLDLLKRDTIDRQGNWHLKYEQVKATALDTLKSSPYADELLVEHDIGFGLLSELGVESTEQKPYLHIRAYNNSGLDKLPFTLLEGRLPQQSNEILMPAHFAQQYGGSEQWIGKSITLNVGERYTEEKLNADNEKMVLDQSWSIVFDQEGRLNEELIGQEQVSYTIVGVMKRLNWEYVSSPGYSFLTYVDEGTLSGDAVVTASLYTAKPDKGIFQELDRLAEKVNAAQWTYSSNNELLRYQFVSSHDGFITTLYSLLSIIIVVIMVGSISLIYNAFGISVADRSRYLGMLASVGATRRQKRNSVLFEGFLISVVSIPIGIGAALLGLWITFTSINPLLTETLSVPVGLEVKVNKWTIIASIAISLLTILLSVWWPAKRAAKVSAIDAIRQTQDVKLTRRQVKTSKLTRKVFGIEAEIAMKNIKRNKRRYQITIFSLVVSIVLFMTVSYLTDSLKRGLYGTSAGVNYDLMMYFDDLNDPNVELLKQLDEIKEYNDMVTMGIATRVAAQYVPESAQRELVGVDGTLQDKYGMSLTIFALSDEKLKQVAEEAGVDLAQLTDPEHPQGILFNVNNYYSSVDQRYVSEQSLLQSKDVLLPLIDYYGEEIIDEDGNSNYISKEREIGSIEIVGSTTTAPLGVTRGSEYGASKISLLVSQAVLEKFGGLDYTNRQIYMTSDNPMALEQQIRDNHLFDNYYINNKYRSQQEEKGVILIISVFSYGFISLITLISVANILNTISTGIQLRRREFAMLRSIGMTEKGFYRMINYESILYGVKSLLYGLPLSFIIMVLIHRSMTNTTYFAFEMPWLSLAIVLVALFIIISFSMLYSGSKVKKGSIVEAIKQENV